VNPRSAVDGGALDVLAAGVEGCLGAGDSIYVEPDGVRGVTCREEGVLLGIFKPARKHLGEDRKHED
jgi:quercetin dioxygenase-like cupin family protein